MKGSLLNNQIVSQMELDHEKIVDKMNQLESKYVNAHLWKRIL